MIDNLRTFRAVVEAGSFTAAASRAGLSPAGVMKQVNQLEKAVGTPLLERSKTGVSPTAAGETLYENAAEVLLAYDEAFSRARARAEEASHIVRVGYSLLNPATELIARWGRVGASHPEIRLQMVPFIDESRELSRLYESLGHEIDCIVGPYDTELHPNVRGLELGRASFCIAVPRDHALVRMANGGGAIRPSDLAGLTVMLSRPGSISVVDEIRNELTRDVPGVAFRDLPANYGPELFNLCEQSGNPLLALDMWNDVHPSLAMVPVKWANDRSLPIGVMYASLPNPALRSMIEALQEDLHHSAA